MLNNDYNGFSFFSTRFHGNITLYSNFKWPEYVKGPLTKDVRLTPGEGGSAESGRLIVIRV